MRILFQLVHPAKYQFHKETINMLISEGHHVDILIQKKDILENLVKNENWNFFNLFPRGRKTSIKPKFISNILMLILTTFKQLFFVRKKSYDLFVGGELGIIGKFRGVPSVYVTDDDIVNTPQQHQACFFADYIFCPIYCDMGIYNSKRIVYDGFKALCHLHPNYFKPNKFNLPKKLRDKRFFLIRTCSHNSTHDIIGTKGISNKALFYLTKLLDKFGQVVLTSERTLPSYFNKYDRIADKDKIGDYIFFSDIFIGDSVTMSVEACVLGTVSIEYDNWWYKFDQMIPLSNDYKLLMGVKPENIKSLLQTTAKIIRNTDENRMFFKEQAKRLINEKMDVAKFQHWILSKHILDKESFPLSESLAKSFYSYKAK